MTSTSDFGPFGGQDFIEVADLQFFSVALDLLKDQQAPTFDTKRLNDSIAQSAHRAVQVCNATAQQMLAQYRPNPDQTDDQDIAQVKAEHIAFDLGFQEYSPDRAIDNPFDEPLLAQAWQDGVNSARQKDHHSPMQELEEKLWEQGIDTEDSRSHYELCALQLYKIAARLGIGPEAERAKRLAMEMCRYFEGESPTPSRQTEINRFMAAQTARMAEILEI